MAALATKPEEKKAASKAAADLPSEDLQPVPAGAPAGMPRFASGRSLDSSTRSSMEERFGHSFSDVRVHTDETAAASARDLGTNAFAAGQDIFFGGGRFQPGTREGDRLLAHELTHTIQQGNGTQAIQADTPGPSSFGDPLEREAEAVANQVAGGGRAGPISAATPGIIQRDPPTGGQPPADPGTAIVPSSLTLDNLIRPAPAGFVDPVLDRAYQSYRSDQKDPADPRTWALRQTSGGPRARLELLLGTDYAVGQRTGPARPPVNVLDTTRPAGYTDAQLAQNYQALAQNLSSLPGITNLLQAPIPGGMMNSGSYANLQGMVGEALARQPLLSALDEVRQKEPDAQLFLNVRARLLSRSQAPGGAQVFTPGDPVQFTDGIIGAIRGGRLIIFRIAEVKSGPGGGVQAAEQIFRWIEAHATVGFIIELPGVTQAFEYSDARHNVVNLTTATRLAFVPQGVQLPGLRSGHGTAAKTQLMELPATPEQVQYLTRLVARNIMQFQAALAAMHSAAQNVLNPLRLTSVEQFRDPAVRRQILSEHGGLAMVNGRLFRLTVSGDNVQVRVIAPSAISPQLGAGAGGTGGFPALPPGGGAQRVSPATPELAIPPQAPALPPPAAPMLPPPPAPQGALNAPSAPNAAPSSGAEAPAPVVDTLALMQSITGQQASEGDLEVTRAAVQFRLTPTGLEPLEPTAPGGDIWFVKDVKSGKAVAGILEGSVWYSVTEEGHFMPLDSEFQEIAGAEPLTAEQMRNVLEGFKNPEAEGPAGGGGPSGGARVVAGGMAAIMVINEVLAPYNMAINQERQNIAQQQAAIDFWTVYGANPTFGMWDRTDNSWTDAYGHQVSSETAPDTSGWGGETTPYIADLDIDGFRANFPNSIHNYKEFLMFMDAARQISAFGEEPAMEQSPTKEELAVPRRYTVAVNWMNPKNKKIYDITDIINSVRDRTLAALDTEMTGKLAQLPAADRKNVKRLKKGSETVLYRSAGGGFWTWHGPQQIPSAQQLLGPDPWVRPVGPRQNGKTLVTAANADAERSSLVSAYLILNDMEDVLKEVQAGGRKVEERIPKEGEGDLISFVAGPDAGGVRFGETRYYRQPGNPKSTVAIGELRQFWVDDDDLESVDEQKVEAKIAPAAK